MYVMGADDSVSAAVAAEVRAAAQTVASGSARPVRIAGANRYQTSAAAAEYPGPISNTIRLDSPASAEKTALLASGQVNADALAAGPLAAA